MAYEDYMATGSLVVISELYDTILSNTQIGCLNKATQLVDFTKGPTRDEVSFYKNLARTEQAKALGIDIKDYEELIKLHKSGKYIVNFVKVLNPN